MENEDVSQWKSTQMQAEPTKAVRARSTTPIVADAWLESGDGSLLSPRRRGGKAGVERPAEEAAGPAGATEPFTFYLFTVGD